MDFLEIKKKLGHEAAKLVESGMIIGLGTGSTAECLIASLIERVKREKLAIHAIASSDRSAQLAIKGSIPIIDINKAPQIDLTIDGADEIDPQKRLIKGAGGALLREKILAAASREMIVIADETKLVAQLGKTKLPIEIVRYGASVTQKKIESLGYKGVWRMGSSQDFFVTDNGNILFDIVFEKPIQNPEKMESELRKIPGVIDTGFFFHLAKRILIGYKDGSIKML